MKITVANIRDTGDGEYIGRATHGRPASPLANPYKVAAHGRDGAIRAYRQWLWAHMHDGDQTVMSELLRLLRLACRPTGVTLLCWCKPKPCHGDIVKGALEWLSTVTDDPVVAAGLELGATIRQIGASNAK